MKTELSISTTSIATDHLLLRTSASMVSITTCKNDATAVNSNSNNLHPPVWHQNNLKALYTKVGPLGIMLVVAGKQRLTCYCSTPKDD